MVDTDSGKLTRTEAEKSGCLAGDDCGCSGFEITRNGANCVILYGTLPSAVTPRIQEAHVFGGHLWAEFVEADLFGESEKRVQK